jgi:hypothetical protein
MTRIEMSSRQLSVSPATRSLLDWLLILVTTGLFAILAMIAKLPHIDVAIGWAVGLAVAMLALLTTCGISLWRTTRFR